MAMMAGQRALRVAGPSGALKTGTPLLTASTPVMAVQPLANARMRSQRLTASVGGPSAGGAETGAG